MRKPAKMRISERVIILFRSQSSEYYNYHDHYPVTCKFLKITYQYDARRARGGRIRVYLKYRYVAPVRPAAARVALARGKRFHTQKISSILKIFVCVHKHSLRGASPRSSRRPCWSPRLRWIGTLSCAADTPCCAARRQQAAPRRNSVRRQVPLAGRSAPPARVVVKPQRSTLTVSVTPTPKCPVCTRSPSARARVLFTDILFLQIPFV